jgi:D-3-phosphoglycerate dehydrogenase / 2-oxoglutarate reductase
MLFLSILKCVFKSVIKGWAVFFVLIILNLVLICSSLKAHPLMIQKTKISIIDDFHSVFLQQLQPFFEVDYQPTIDKKDLLSQVVNSEVIAVRSKVVFDETLLKLLPNLKCIARGGAGMDNIDEEYAQKNGIVLLNAPEGNRNAVAEHCIGLLIGLSKNIVKGHQDVIGFNWDREGNRGWEIKGKKIGIIGFGNTGSAFAHKLSSFDCEILVYDKFKNVESNSYLTNVDLETLKKESDVISLHVPLTKETNQMINNSFIEGLKQGVVLINTSRGNVVNQVSVLNWIKSGKIKQYATDVLENENLKSFTSSEIDLFESLLATNQVIITPHVAGWSHESYFNIADVLSKKLIDFSLSTKKN